MHKRWGYILLFLLTGCISRVKTNIEERKPRAYASVLSGYFGMPVDTMTKYLQTFDSAEVKSVGLSFYYFIYKRDSGENGIVGTLVLDHSNNNSYIESKRTNRDFFGLVYRGDNYLKPEVLETFKNRHFLLNKDSWKVQKLESILNNLQLPKKALLNRNILDSIFQFYYLGPKSTTSSTFLFKNQHDFDMGIDSFMKNTTTYFPTIYGHNLKYVSEFRKFVDNNFDKANFFMYKRYNSFFLVTVNENFINDSASRNYYRAFSNENMLYQINEYDLSW